MSTSKSNLQLHAIFPLQMSFQTPHHLSNPFHLIIPLSQSFLTSGLCSSQVLLLCHIQYCTAPVHHISETIFLLNSSLSQFLRHHLPQALSPFRLSTLTWSITFSRIPTPTHSILHLPILNLNNTHLGSCLNPSNGRKLPLNCTFGQPIWFDTALVKKLVPCTWLSIVALEVWIYSYC